MPRAAVPLADSSLKTRSLLEAVPVLRVFRLNTGGELIESRSHEPQFLHDVA